MTSGSLVVLPATGIGEIRPGDSVADAIAAVVTLEDGDVVIVTQKIVSKAEGRLVAFDGSSEGRRAIIEAESARILRRRGDLLITETRHGFVCANAGVDVSNVSIGFASLLPVDPDRSARRIRDGIRRSVARDVAVVISDSFGRPWRRGVTDIAIGVAGIAAILDLRGALDASGRPLVTTEVCIADELASAADLVMGKSTGIPAAVIRGVDREWFRRSSVHDEVVRPADNDLFR
jgi:coenzyme F420-0:L-glutamate ligase/coenzyme F420-1:gamma-L-glutamate ligase